MTAVLEARGLSVSREVGVLQDVDLAVGEWEIVGVAGPPGAGATSLVDALTGAVPSAGQVLHRGVDVSAAPAHRRAAAGVARTFQRPAGDPSLTLAENVLTAQHARIRSSAVAGILGGPAAVLDEREARTNAQEVLFFLGLEPMASTPLGDLGLPDRKRCDLAMALAADPDVLILDQPSWGLGPARMEGLAATLRSLRSALNLTILLADRMFPLLREACDFVYVLDRGSIRASGLPAEVERHPAAAAAYLGAEAQHAAP